MPDKPNSSLRPGNQWLVAASFAGLLLAGCYSPPPQPSPPPAPAKAGGDLFQSYCAACHQYDGQAVGEAPPLDNSPWVTGPEDRLIKLVLHGVRGEMEIQGKVYNREMPGFGQILSDADAASLLTFVRTSFGPPSSPISADAVSQVRAANEDRTDYWSVEKLLAEP
jgi:mono/diheme cytochrome c family protein